MPCDKCLTGEKHGNSGQVTFTITLTTGALGCTEPELLLEKLKSMVESKAIDTFDAWTVQIDNGSYEPYKRD
jgi:hypothetical protein